jgi:xylan 1,4-beta-xylosidase
LAAPLPKPRGGSAGPGGFALSDDFSTNKLGIQWSFFTPGADELQRARYEDNSLVIAGKGSSPADCSPLTCVLGDRSYEATVSLEITGAAQGGLALFYDNRGFVGVGFTREEMLTYNYGQEQPWLRQRVAASLIHLKVTNRSNVVTFHYSPDGRTWTQHPLQMEVSGYHHNVFGGFLSLRIGLFSAGRGAVRARNFTYRSLES